MTTSFLNSLFLFAFLIMGNITQDDNNIVFRVNAGEYDLINHPVSAELPSSRYTENSVVCLSSGYGNSPVPGQITLSGSHAKLWWTVSQSAGETVDYRILTGVQCSSSIFSWNSPSPSSTRLNLGDLPVLQYEHQKFDPEDTRLTMKPFHHLFDPAGKQKITKGPGGLYGHHRGIFYGYRVYIGGSDERIDIWGSVRQKERSEHYEIIAEYSGPVTGGHVMRIMWKDFDGEPFAEEIRELRAYRQGRGETLIDFNSTITSLIDEHIHLGGDRHHGGVQFRASQEVADQEDGNGTSLFIRPANLSHIGGRVELGDDDDIMDLPWNAFNFSVNKRPYTVAYMSHPSNPEGAEMSERLYGRFGEFIPYDLENRGDSLKLQYRFWVVTGEAPSVEEIDQRYSAYAATPVVEVLKGFR